MNWNYRNLLPPDFSPESRAWIYQSNRLLTVSEALQVEDALNAFVSGWNSHGTPVKGFGTLFFGHFIVLLADESATGVSGCSTDSSVRLMHDLEQRLQVNLFDRQLLAFVINDKIQLLPLAQLGYAADNGFVEAGTPYFDNTVLTKKDLEDRWIIPAGSSWLAKRVPFANLIM